MSAPAIPTADGPRPLMRTYTPRSFDTHGQVLAVDFVLHGTGPAATWAAGATPGQRLLVMGPGPGYQLDKSATRWLLIGDESALPAIETILEQIRTDAKVDVLVEIVNVEEKRMLGPIEIADIQWTLRGNDASRAGESLLTALQQQQRRPSTGVRVYLACEASAMRRIKQWLIANWQIEPANIVGRGYWKLDSINHPDQDYGD